MTSCPHRIELGVERRPANALNVEVGTPLPRCRIQTPEHWGKVDPRGGRWLLSGGSPLVLAPCSSANCPLSTGKSTDDENAMTIDDMASKKASGVNIPEAQRGTVQVKLRLPPDVKDDLDVLAERWGLTVSGTVALLVERALETGSEGSDGT